MQFQGLPRNGEWPSLPCPWSDIYYQEHGDLGRPDIVRLSREEINCAGCGFFCGIELFVVMQHGSKVNQTLCLFRRVTKPFKDF